MLPLSVKNCSQHWTLSTGVDVSRVVSWWMSARWRHWRTLHCWSCWMSPTSITDTNTSSCSMQWCWVEVRLRRRCDGVVSAAAVQYSVERVAAPVTSVTGSQCYWHSHYLLQDFTAQKTCWTSQRPGKSTQQTCTFEFNPCNINLLKYFKYVQL